MFLKFAICSIALLSFGETFHLKGRDMVTLLLLSCYDCNSTRQHYYVTRFKYVLWRRTMHEWVMNIHYQIHESPKGHSQTWSEPPRNNGACVIMKFVGWPWKKGTSFIVRQALCIISKPSMNSNWIYSPKTPKSCQSWRFFVTCDREIWHMTLKTMGHLFYNTSSIVHHLKASAEFKPESLSGNSQFGSKSVIFCPAWPWREFEEWPWKTIARLSYTLGTENRVVRNRYSRLLFPSEDRPCANLRVQEQSTNMTSQCQCLAFAWRRRSIVMTAQC